MKLNRKTLRKMILNEIRILTEKVDNLGKIPARGDKTFSFPNATKNPYTFELRLPGYPNVMFSADVEKGGKPFSVDDEESGDKPFQGRLNVKLSRKKSYTYKGPAQKISITAGN